MLMSSKIPPTTSPVLGKSSLSDIAPIFNLIQSGSRHGHFSNLYTRPRYMAGLGIQLFSLWKSSEIKLPDRTEHRADMKVLRVGGDFAGFIVLRHEAHRPAESEIYMCALENDFRGRGLGEWMLREALSDVPIGHVVVVSCLPASIQMKSLLLKLRFRESNIPSTSERPQIAQRFVYECHALN